MLRLENRFKQLENWSDSILGVSAVHLPTNKIIQYNAALPFLLCSTDKIPVAVCLLKKIEEQLFHLHHEVTIHDYDLRPGVSSTLNQLKYDVPVNMSIINLLQFMMRESCNTAADKILQLVGGPHAVMQMINDAGIHDLRVDRNNLEALADWDGLGKFISPDYHCTLEQYQAFESKISPQELEDSRNLFMNDNQDRATPSAVTQLLLKITAGSIINPQHAEILFNIMQSCKTGPNRIMGLLPPNTKVSHKTGTIRGYINDVGIIYGPEKSEKIILSIFTENHANPHLGERLIAEAARTIYDYFMLSE